MVQAVALVPARVPQESQAMHDDLTSLLRDGRRAEARERTGDSGQAWVALFPWQYKAERRDRFRQLRGRTDTVRHLT